MRTLAADGRFRVLWVGIFGMLGVTGAFAAFQHYYRRDIPKTGSEQRINVKIDAPYGSVIVKSGAAPQSVATIETDGDSSDAPSLQFNYAIRNHSVGILHIGVGTDEGMLDQPVVAWRASQPNFSLASASAAQSDLGSAASVPHPFGFPPISHYGLPQFRFVVTDAGTCVTEVVPPSSALPTKISLTQDIPMVFSADLGFGESTVDLTGLSLVNAQIETGASKAHLSINQPNPLSMNSCSVSAGLGECTFDGISNLNVSSFLFNGGVGSYHLGFEGKLSKNLDATIQLGLGRCMIVIPPSAARVQVFYDDGLLSSYLFSGLSKRRDGYATSVGFDQSNSPILTLRLSSGMGKMSVIYK